MSEPTYVETMAQKLWAPLEMDYDESLADDVCHAVEAVIREVIERCASEADRFVAAGPATSAFSLIHNGTALELAARIRALGDGR